jgi:uncharacterized membrane protein
MWSQIVHDLLLIVGMSIIAFTLRVSGYWLNHFLSARTKRELKLGSFAGLLLVAMIVPAAAAQGPSAWIGATAAFLVAWNTKSLVLSVSAGVTAFILAQLL